jgi:hypothetical protein
MIGEAGNVEPGNLLNIRPIKDKCGDVRFCRLRGRATFDLRLDSGGLNSP